MLNSRTTALLLIAVCVLLGSSIFHQLNEPQIMGVVRSVEPTDMIKLEETPRSQLKPFADISTFDEIIDRPLFSETRQPEVEEKEEVVVEPEVIPVPIRKPDFILTGIVLSGDDKIAFIKNNDNNTSKVKSVALNKIIEGWTLFEVSARSIKLKSGDQQISLDMRKRKDLRLANNAPFQQPVNNQPMPDLNRPQSTPTLPVNSGVSTAPVIPVSVMNLPPEIPLELR